MSVTTRRWRVVIALDFPMRQPEMVDEHGDPGFPAKLVFTTRVEQQTVSINGVTIGIRPWSGEPLPVEITGSLGLNREIIELVLLVDRATTEDALTAIAPIVEQLVEGLSFDSQYASRPIMTTVSDVTQPVAIGESREFSQLTGFPLATFQQTAVLGQVEVTQAARLPQPSSHLAAHIAAARGWYVKSLSTSYIVDQFIFLWIALESLWGKSPFNTSGPLTCRHGHEIATCPTCDTPMEKPVFGLGIRSYLVGACRLSADEAKSLWKARQIMHGAMPFDSQVMRDLLSAVIMLRAAVARALKSELGLGEHDLPRIAASSLLSIDPSQMGVYGTRIITAGDLLWPESE